MPATRASHLPRGQCRAGGNDRVMKMTQRCKETPVIRLGHGTPIFPLFTRGQLWNISGNRRSPNVFRQT